MDEQIVRDTLRNFITRDLIRDDSYPLTDTEGIITGGLMDSFALAEFGVFVEEQFDVFISDVELTVANMDSLNQMVDRIMRGRAR